MGLAADPDRVIGAGEERVVARRVAVRPHDGIGDPGRGEPLLESAHLLGPTAVRAGQPPRENARAASRSSSVHTTPSPRCCDPNGTRYGSREAETRTTAWPSSRCCRVVRACRVGATASRSPARTSAPCASTASASMPANAVHTTALMLSRSRRTRALDTLTWLPHEREPGVQAHRSVEERCHAVARRQRPVDVERSDDGSLRGGHRRTRLYTRSMSEQSPEIFDDLYLGLQAGGALRKQRRGEELTEQEQAALGRWQRLSVVAQGRRRSAPSRSARSGSASPSAASSSAAGGRRDARRVSHHPPAICFCRLRVILKPGTYGSP